MITEKEIEQRFYQFLLDQKKYPTTSLLRQAPTYALANGGSVKVDLILLDVRIGEYIGMIEFKGILDPKVKTHAARRLAQYRELLKAPDLPTYLVHALDGKDFQIQVFEEGGWKPIDKEEFPEFETLSAKKIREEKVLQREAEDNLAEAFTEKRQRIQKLSLWTLGSLIGGVIAAVMAIVLSVGGLKPTSVVESARLDSLELNITRIRQTIELSALQIDSLRTADTSATYVDLSRRLSAMEGQFAQSSDRALLLEGIKSDLRVLRADMQGQERVLTVRHENMLDRIAILYALVTGMILALFGAAIGFVITAYNDRRKVH